MTMTMTSTTTHHGDDCTVVRNVSWERYIALRDDPEQIRKRMTYHRGVLENRSTECRTQRIKRIVEILIDIWTEVSEVRQIAFGSTTFQLESVAAGLEPDSCYYVGETCAAINHDELDLLTHHPPNLAIDVEPTPGVIDRLAVYSDLGFPEVWLTDGNDLQVHLRSGDKYRTTTETQALSGLSLDGLMAFVQRWRDTDATTLMREFRLWATAQKPSAGSDA